MEGPEIHAPHAHHHRGLPRWLELLIAFTALATSVGSIVLAVHHGRTMEKLVQANSIPYLEGGSSNVTDDGALQIKLELSNQGVGPAHEQSLRIRIGDRYVTSLKELLQVVYGPEDAKAASSVLKFTTQDGETRFLSANKTQVIFSTDRTPENARYWQILDASRPDWNLEYCYCSVFDDCWVVRDDAREKVKMCHRDPAREFIPSPGMVRRKVTHPSLAAGQGARQPSP